MKRLVLLATMIAAVARAEDVTDAVTKGVNYLRQQAATNEQAWFFPPLETKKITGWTTNVVMCKEVVLERPVYEYEMYEVLVPGGSAGEPPRREMRKRIKGVKGTEKFTKLVEDPAGTIRKEKPVPLFAATEGNRWRYGSLGFNAAAVFALRRCGVTADDPLVAKPAESLAHFVETFGLPDHTVDLAWFTAAFAELPEDRFKELTSQCAGKLLDAQMTTGPGAGMWGPVAIHPGLLSAYLKLVTRLGDERQAVVADKREAKPGKSKEKTTQRLDDKLAALDARLAGVQSDMARVSQIGFRLFDALGVGFREQIQLKSSGEEISFEGLPYLIHNQLTTDLESTALAVFALRVAAENKRLPARSWRPVPAKGEAPLDLPAARETREVLASVKRALAGPWSEMNGQQPVTDLAWLKTIPPAKAELFTALPAPVTFNSTSRGAGTLMNLEMIWTGRLTPVAVGELPESAAKAGSPRGLYDVLPVLAGTSATNTALVNWLLGQQNPTGSWGKEKAHDPVFSTSVNARYQTLPATPPAAMQTVLDRPHLTPLFGNKAVLTRRWGAPNATHSTVMALIFLADGLPAGWMPPAQ